MIFEENSLKSIYNLIMILQLKHEFVKFHRDKFAKITQRKNNRFFNSIYFLNKNELLKHYGKIYVFDKLLI